VLPEPITSAWVTGCGSHIFEVAAPADWHTITVPQDVFDHPERWIDR
jgi:hypothetical protein